MIEVQRIITAYPGENKGRHALYGRFLGQPWELIHKFLSSERALKAMKAISYQNPRFVSFKVYDEKTYVHDLYEDAKNMFRHTTSFTAPGYKSSLS